MVETVVAVAKSQSEDVALAFAKKHVCETATIATDEHGSYNVLRDQFKIERFNHQQNYVGPQGQYTNNAESYFSLLRRMHLGQNHKFGNKYLDRYAREAAYREDTRWKPNGFIFNDVLARRATSVLSGNFADIGRGIRRPAKI